MDVKLLYNSSILLVGISICSCSANQILIKSANEQINERISRDVQSNVKNHSNAPMNDLSKGYYFSFGLQHTLPFKEQSTSSGALNFSFRWNKFLTDNISFFTNYDLSGMVQGSQSGYSFLEGAFDAGLRLNLFDSISISSFLGYGIMEYDSKDPNAGIKYTSAYGDRYGFGLGWYKRKDESRIYSDKENKHQLGYYGLSIEVDKYFKLNSLGSHRSITPQWRGRILFTAGFEF